MTNMKKTRNSLALAVALGSAAMLASSQTFAAPQNPNVANGGLQAANAAVGANDNTTPYVAKSGLGQALIMPYYTTRNKLRTAINLMNTSDDTLAVKVTIREGKYSRDVLNFYVLMSPHDAWSGFLSDTDGITTLVRSTDEDSCVVGAFGELKDNVFTAMKFQEQKLKTDGLVDVSNGDTRHEGYITAIVAGKVDTRYVRQTTVAGISTNSPVGRTFAGWVKHGANGKPANCQAVAANTNFFNRPKGVNANFNRNNIRGGSDLENLFLGLAPGDNPLKGNLSILDAGNGIAGGTQATAIANFNQNTAGRLPAVATGPNANGVVVRTGEVRGDLVTPQVFPYFNEPSLASGQGLCNNANAGLTQVEDAMRANSIINEWSQFANTGAETDWVITFPTKGFRTDHSTGNPNALGVSSCRNTVSNALLAGGITRYDNNGRPGSTNFGVSSNARDNGLPIFYSLSAVDREEKERIGAPAPSPQIGGTPFLPREVNVITFKPTGQEGPLGSKHSINIDLASQINGTPNGWAELKFARGQGNVAPVARRSGAVTPDLAALGFMFKVRKQPGAATTNFGQIIDHSTISVSP